MHRSHHRRALCIPHILYFLHALYPSSVLHLSVFTIFMTRSDLHPHIRRGHPCLIVASYSETRRLELLFAFLLIPTMEDQTVGLMYLMLLKFQSSCPKSTSKNTRKAFQRERVSNVGTREKDRAFIFSAVTHTTCLAPNDIWQLVRGSSYQTRPCYHLAIPDC